MVDSGAPESTMSTVQALHLVIGSSETRGGLDGNIEATMAIRDGCALFTSTSGMDMPAPAIWPLGTTSDETGVVLPDGRRIEDGDFVRMTGGGIDETGFERVAVPETLTPEALNCASGSSMFLINTRLNLLAIVPAE